MRNKMVLSGKRPVVEFVEPKRSPAQNSALHLWLESVAALLNAGGHDMRVILKPEVAIEWNKTNAKEYLWRPIQKALTGEESSTKPSKTEYPDIYETLCKHFAEKHGIQLPDWPTREAP